MSEHEWPAQEPNRTIFRLYNDARLLFCKKLAESVGSHPELTIGDFDFLRDINVYNIAQFFYLFKAYEIRTEEQVREYCALHDAHMMKAIATFTKLEKEELEKEEEQQKLERARRQEGGKCDDESGPKRRLHSTRYVSALYTRLPREGETPRQKKRAKKQSDRLIGNFVENLRDGLEKGKLSFGLPDLQRGLIESMVKETSTTTCKRLRDLGLIEWDDKNHPEVIVTSTGVLEDCFRDHLTFLAEELARCLNKRDLPGV